MEPRPAQPPAASHFSARGRPRPAQVLRALPCPLLGTRLRPSCLAPHLVWCFWPWCHLPVTELGRFECLFNLHVTCLVPSPRGRCFRQVPGSETKDRGGD